MVSSRVQIRPQARRDLDDTAAYLADASESVDLAYRFLDAAEASFERLVAMPGIGLAREYRDPALANIRMWPIDGFHSYFIFYRCVEADIEIVRVIHAKRDIDGLFGGRS